MARPSEIKAVVALLMEPAADVTELAKTIIGAVDEARRDRVDFVVGAQCGKLAYGYGPYATYKQAEKAILGGRIPAIDGTRFFVLPMRHPSQVDATWLKTDESPISEEAQKLWEIARNGGMPAKTHSRRNRRRVA